METIHIISCLPFYKGTYSINYFEFVRQNVIFMFAVTLFWVFFRKLCFSSLPMYHVSFSVELTWSLTLYMQGWTLYRPGDETSQHRSPLQVGRTHPPRRDQRHGWNCPNAGSPGLWPSRKPTRLHQTRARGVYIQLLTGEADKLLIDV